MSRLIVLEGLDGAGTTTQARRLADRLGGLGRSVHLTREPSDNPVGGLLREFLVGRHAIEGRTIAPATLALLFAADRMDHLQREVEPQLRAGRIVVSDRWYHSSLAYQGSSSGEVSQEWVMALNDHARQPDLTIFLEVDPEVCAHRRLAAGRTQELFDDLEIQRRVALGYLAAIALVTQRGDRVVILDGEASVDQVSSWIGELVEDPATWRSSRVAAL